MVKTRLFSMQIASCKKEFETLLEKFRRLPGNAKLVKTYLEISNFPRSELALSNILAFYLDPGEEHGFQDLFLRSFLRFIDPDSDLDAMDFHSAKIIREDRTDNNKRIDVVIDAGPLVIGIENKIDADDTYNPFDEYKFRIQQVANGRPSYCVLLSLNGACPDAARKAEFRPLSYQSLFTSVEADLGRVLLRAHQPYLTFLIDFMTTVKNLKKGIRMDQQTLDFFRNNEANALKFYLCAKDVIDQLREKAESVKTQIKVPSGFQNPWLSPFYNDTEPTGFYDVITCRAVLLNGLQIAVDASIELAKGWNIYVWNPPKDSGAKVLHQSLGEKGVFPSDPQKTDGWMWRTFEFNADSSSVAEAYQGLLNEIAPHVKT